jgi:hypothetical protein
MIKASSVILLIVAGWTILGCGEKDEPNPQITQTPTKEQLDLAKGGSGDAANPLGQNSDK